MRTSPGCLICKLRRKRCDLKKPVCTGCRRNHLLCGWKDDPGRHGRILPHQLNPDWAVISTMIRTKPSAGENLLQSSCISHLPQLRDAESRFLYSHFVHCTADAVSTQDLSSNPFLKLLLPIAMHYDMVLNSIVALGGVHYRQKGSEQYTSSTWLHHSQAIQQVKHGLTRVLIHDPTLAPALAICTLLFAFIELVRGDTDGNAFHHLRATRHLLGVIRRPNVTRMEAKVYGFVLEWYSYLLSLSILFDAHPDGELVEYSNSLFVELSRIDISLRGVLYGCAHDLFRMIPDVMTTAQIIHAERSQHGMISPATQQHANSLIRLVHAWQPASPEREYVIAGQIYQLAILALLQADTDFKTLHLLVEQLPGLLLALPVQSNVTTTLCWPIGILGGFAQSLPTRHAIRGYLTAMTGRYGFGNFRQTVLLLDSIWDMDAPPMEMGAFTLQSMMASKGCYFILA